MNTAELARRQFHEIARVSGLILQPMPGAKSASKQRELQSSSSLLFEVLRRYDPENLLLAQAEREILEKQLELTRLKNALEKINAQPFLLRETDKLTPFAFPLWAERVQATHLAQDASTRLESMLNQLNQIRAHQPPEPPHNRGFQKKNPRPGAAACQPPHPKTTPPSEPKPKPEASQLVAGG